MWRAVFRQGKQQAWGPEMGKRGPWKTEERLVSQGVSTEVTTQGKADLVIWHVRKGDQ